MKTGRESCERLSAIHTFRNVLRGTGVVIFGVSLTLFCFSLAFRTDLTWSAEESRPRSEVSGSLAGRPTVTPVDHPQATPETTEDIGSVSAVEAPLKSASAPNDWPVLLREGFDDNGYDWDVGTAHFDSASLRRTLGDGAYLWDLDVRKPVMVWGESGVEVPGKFYAAVDVRLINGRAADVNVGLALVPDDLADMRLFLLSMTDGVTVQRGIGDLAEIVIPWTNVPAIRRDAYNRLAIKSLGSTLTLYLNDEQIVTTSVDISSSGRLCMAVWSNQPGQYAVQFDNFEVRAAPGSVITPPAVPLRTATMPTPLPWGSILPEAPHTSPPNWPIVFWDTFVDDGNGWVTYEQFDRQMESSKLVEGTFAWQFKAIEAVQSVVKAPHSEVSEFYAAVDVKRYTGPEDVWAGLAFRRADERHFYTFLVNDRQRYQIEARAGDVLSHLVDPTPSEAIVVGGPNRVAVVGEGATFTFFVNGQAVTALHIEASGVQFAEGGLGLALDATAGDVGIIEFDNFEVRVPPKE